MRETGRQLFYTIEKKESNSCLSICAHYSIVSQTIISLPWQNDIPRWWVIATNHISTLYQGYIEPIKFFQGIGLV
jgi:hypothetical protein